MPLSVLCDTRSPDIPLNFRAYASFCYHGTVWQAVNTGMLLIFLAFKGDMAVAAATLHRDHTDDEWQEGFEVTSAGQDDAKTAAINIRAVYLMKQPKAAIGD